MSVVPVRLYVVKLAQHLRKLVQQIFLNMCKKKMLFLAYVAKGNEFDARTSSILPKLLELAKAKPREGILVP